MATTTNYGWTTPDNTAYVKDGASAIRTLGSSVDTTLNSVTAGKNVGMTILNETSVTAVTSIQINNVFSSTYENYKLVFFGIGSAGGALLAQNVVSGTPATTNYTYALTFANPGGGPSRAASGAGATQAQIGVSGSSYGSIECLIAGPFTTAFTSFNAVGNRWNSTTDYEIQHNAGLHYTGSSYTGIKINVSSGNISGIFRIYGLRNN